MRKLKSETQEKWSDGLIMVRIGLRKNEHKPNILLKVRRRVMKNLKGIFYFLSAALFLTLSMSISHSALYAQMPQNTMAEKFELRLLQLDNAQIEPHQKEYEGIPLTGVVVEIEALASDVKAKLGYSSVTSVSIDGRSIPATIMFLSKLCGSANASLIFSGTSTSSDWTILIGENKFVSGGDLDMMPMILKENGTSLQFSFKEKGRVQVGFLFPENLSNLKSVSLLDKTIELHQQTSKDKLVETMPEAFSGITIKGVISNWAAAKKYICEDSFLQLIALSKGGGIIMAIDSQGRRIIESMFPKVSIPANGNFTLNFESLDAGKYAIVAQNIGEMGASILMKGKKSAEIKIRKDEKLPLTVELGEVVIPVK